MDRAGQKDIRKAPEPAMENCNCSRTDLTTRIGAFSELGFLSKNNFSHPPDFANEGLPTPSLSAISPAKAATPLSLHRNGRGCGKRRGQERATRTWPAKIPAPLFFHPLLGFGMNPTFKPAVKAIFSLSSQGEQRPKDLQTDRGPGVCGRETQSA